MTDQLAIDFNAPAQVVRARRTDPETSREAAAALDAQQPKVQRSVEIATRILRERGPLSDFQLSELWASYWGPGFSESLPRKARHWAKEAGRVEFHGHGEHQGRRVRLWRAA